MALLEARGLIKFYGRRCVVDGVDFHVNAGEVVGLLGPNGAGKTTSFKMTMGFVPPNGGNVLFNGHDVTGLQMYMRARLGMGYLPQETSIFRKLTVEQNIVAILEMAPPLRSVNRKLTRTERWERTDKVLGEFGLTHVRKNVAARLSGGEKRRLEIARCLVCEPLLILMDEPFTGIDPKTIADIQQIVIALRKQGIGILLTDHNVREALKITTRSYLIKDGKVRTHGTPYQIINDPIAISEYLGVGFNDDSFARNPDEPPRPAAPTPVALIPAAEKPIAIIQEDRPTLALAAAKPVAVVPAVEKPAALKPAAEKPAVPVAEKPGALRPSPVPMDDLDNLIDDGTQTAPAPPPKPAPPRSAPPKPAPPRPVERKPRTTEPVASAPEKNWLDDEDDSLRFAVQQAEKWNEEKPERLVEQLKSSNALLAAAALKKKGSAAVPALLAALERRDVELRCQVVAILEESLQRPIAFDPFAPEATRMRQLASLREAYERRAG